MNDIDFIVRRFKNIHSYFSLIKFTYKYLEIDIIEFILKVVAENDIVKVKQILDYLLNQWNLLIKAQSDYEDFNNGLIGVDLKEWLYVKQVFLLDNRVSPALLDMAKLKDFVYSLYKKWHSMV